VQVSRSSKVPFGRQVPFSLAGFIVLAAYKVPARGTILNGSELRPREVASLARCVCMYSGASRKKTHKTSAVCVHSYVYGPSLKFKKNKGTSSRRRFSSHGRRSNDFFQSRMARGPGRDPRRDLPGPESDLREAQRISLHLFVSA